MALCHRCVTGDRFLDTLCVDGSVLPSGGRYIETLFVYGVYSSVNLLLTFVMGYGFKRCNMIR